jgi:hypothetical protein
LRLKIGHGIQKSNPKKIKHKQLTSQLPVLAFRPPLLYPWIATCHSSALGQACGYHAIASFKPAARVGITSDSSVMPQAVRKLASDLFAVAALLERR